MAYNLGMSKNNKDAEDFAKSQKEVENAIHLHLDLEDSAPGVVEVDNTIGVDGREKERYYMEWWKIGTRHENIEQHYFHTNFIKHFVKVFLSTKRYTIVYLRRESDGRVLKDARSTLGTGSHRVNG